MKKFIKDVLVEMHKDVTTDKYGQVNTFNYTPDLFGDRADEVEQYCSVNKGILQFSTYGGSFGTYRAFNIKDKDIKKACMEVLHKNKNYLNNVNRRY